jgi:hypothetical protein
MDEYVYVLNSDEVIHADVALSSNDSWRIEAMVKAGWDRYVATLKVVGSRGRVTIQKP